jgi:hypothetical protein
MLMFMRWVQQMRRPHIYNLSTRHKMFWQSLDQYKKYSRDRGTGEPVDETLFAQKR